MQLLLTSAAHSNIGQDGDTIIQTQNCVSPCAWVKLIFSVSRIVILAQGPCFLHVQILQATRFVRVILEQGSISSSQGGKNNDNPSLCVLFLCKPYLCIIQKKNISDVDCHSCAGAMKQYLESQRSEEQGPCNSVQRKIRRQARHEVRTSGPALEGSIVSPLVNTISGLSGGRRGGDVSGAASAPSLVVARLLARALALALACGIRCPPFVIRKACASDGSSTPRRKSSAMR